MRIDDYSNKFLIPKNWNREADKAFLTRRTEAPYKEFIEKVTPILQRVYPDRWDIQFLAKRAVGSELDSITPQRLIKRILFYQPYIIIHFPYSKVINKYNSSIEIHDMFVKIILTADNTDVMISELNGLMQTFTREQALVGYQFSHLYSRQPSSHPEYQGFCLGSGEILQVKALFNSTRDYGFFELFLYQIEAYLAWESLDGVPYRKMETVGQKTRPNLPTKFSNEYMIFFFNKVLLDISREENSFTGIPIDFFKGSYSIFSDEESFNEFIVNTYYKHYYELQLIAPSDDIFGTLCVKTADGTFISRDNSTHDVSGEYPYDRNPFYFKHKARYLREISVPIEVSSEPIEKFYIHPIIKSYVTERLNKQINERFLTVYNYQKLRDSYNPLKKRRGSNQVLV